MDFNVKDFNVRLRTIKIWELALGLLIAFILIMVLSSVFEIITEDDNLIFIVILSFVLIFFIFALRNTSGLKRDISDVFEIKTRNEILYVFVLNLLFAFLFPSIFSGFDYLYGVFDPNWVTGFDIDTVEITADSLLLECIASIIFAPLLEELIFRGVLFNRLKIRTGIIPAMIISSFLFAIGHDFGGITSAFLFGISMCILYLKTDNIFVTISVHFINNVVATILSLTQLDVITSQMPWLILTGIMGAVATVFLIKYIINEIIVLKKSYN